MARSVNRGRKGYILTELRFHGACLISILRRDRTGVNLPLVVCFIARRPSRSSVFRTSSFFHRQQAKRVLEPRVVGRLSKRILDNTYAILYPASSMTVSERLTPKDGAKIRVPRLYLSNCTSLISLGGRSECYGPCCAAGRLYYLTSRAVFSVAGHHQDSKTSDRLSLRGFRSLLACVTFFVGLPVLR
jgi:hypothetical protein